MKALLLLLFCGICVTAGAQSNFHQEVNYHIETTLHAVDNSLEGFIDLHYINHSRDTLHFIWISLWPNAYRNDRTDFSEDRLNNGKTDFYFSSRDQKGYINQLSFRANHKPAKTEDHPIYQDVIKVLLPDPLLPGDSVSLSSSFHEKLPFNFFGFGVSNNDYQLTNWYPEPAVYDSAGWHPLPLTMSHPPDHEMGNFDVFITVPSNFQLFSATVNPIDTQIAVNKTFHFISFRTKSFSWSTGKYFPTLAEPPLAKKTLRMPGKIINKPSNPLFLGPILGYNNYDHLQLGAVLTNEYADRRQIHPLQFTLMPIFGINSTRFNGIGRVNYHWKNGRKTMDFTAGINAETFSSGAGTDSNDHKLFSRFLKVVPYLRIDFENKSGHPKQRRWADFKTYLINEKEFTDFAVSKTDSLIHPNAYSSQFRYLNQLSVNIRDDRVLYPYDARLEIQQASAFYRINLTAHYFVNYPKGGGLRVRFFAAKFGTWNNNSTSDLSPYEPKLLGVTGEEDYTYDNYFLGRSASTAIENAAVASGGIATQQIMIRDGGLKLRVDSYDYIQGRSTNWVMAVNFSSSIPQKILPVPIPLRVFFDVGTFAEAWQTNALTNRFLYTGGLQLSLFRNVLNIYAPLFYSSDFKDPLRGVSFGKKITFSIDVQNIDPKKIRSRFSN